MSVRDFKLAADCFFDTMATFTSTELMDYRTFCKYSVFCCMVAMGRGEVKKHVSTGQCRPIHSDTILVVCFLCRLWMELIFLRFFTIILSWTTMSSRCITVAMTTSLRVSVSSETIVASSSTSLWLLTLHAIPWILCNILEMKLHAVTSQAFTFTIAWFTIWPWSCQLRTNSSRQRSAM